MMSFYLIKSLYRELNFMPCKDTVFSKIRG